MTTPFPAEAQAPALPYSLFREVIGGITTFFTMAYIVAALHNISAGRAKDVTAPMWLRATISAGLLVLEHA